MKNDTRTIYGALPQCGALEKLLAGKEADSIFLQGLVGSAASCLFAAMAGRCRQTRLFILTDADDAGYFYNDLTQMLPDGQVLFFPSSYRRALKYGQRDNALTILRTEVLARLSRENDNIALGTPSQEPLHIVTYPEALAEMVVGQKQLADNTLRLRVGDTIDLQQTREKLVDLGFSETDYVYEPGQFAIRGSIIDVYSFSGEYPVRIDLFGDEIDTMRTFDVQDQLSRERTDTVEIVPELEASSHEFTPLTSFLPADTIIVVRNFSAVADDIDRIWRDGFSDKALQDRLANATEMEDDEIRREFDRDARLMRRSQFLTQTSQLRHIEFGTHATITPHTTISFHVSPQPLFHKNIDLLTQSLGDYLSRSYKLYILSDSLKQAQRLRDIFDEYSSHHNGHAAITFTHISHAIHEGFADNDLKICLFTDHQIFDRFHKYNLRTRTARAGKMALTMKELQEMEPGDYVVHIDFGIARFGGLVRVPNGDSYQEMIRLMYQHGAIVDVSIHSLYKISKYRRANTDEPPRLSTLGTGAWERLKEKAKKRIKDIARDLIKLYARRRHEKGFAFSTDSYLQHELEANFLYEDTSDQLKATQEVKTDMEQPRPMDRLICGDVGFGKTEVAIRAAFKAACDSKQVAVMVPTTVLAFQHYQTFSERLKGMPVRVDYLSRARSAKQTRSILDDLAAGRIDIIIGTHKLIGKSVRWHDLGLLIIDEEQKFGVATKEKLRQIKTNIDTLTMSATPIPRTLQFSLMGARDMSIIRTPPPNRHPIYTELTTFGSEVIADAINFELSRNGQVYIVCSRINKLAEVAMLVNKYVPDARVAIGHGQMQSDELEAVLMGFINYDYDVLVSTTIIENGIDIPNANTIIICDAQRFGLSDLHQMRGRVGRSNRKAYCYLLAPPRQFLPVESRRRLEALETFAELGSGFNLAMQGAGNLLGAEQSGFMEDLGYETYQKILSQAVTELRNEEFRDIYNNDGGSGTTPKSADSAAVGNYDTAFVDDCTVVSDLEMYFPDSYVPGSSERMLLYRELDKIETDQALEAYRQRMIDRFGPIPREGEELMLVVPLRRLARKAGCERIMLNQGMMTMQFVSYADSPFYRSKTFAAVLDFIASNARRCDITEQRGRRLAHIRGVNSVSEALDILRHITEN